MQRPPVRHGARRSLEYKLTFSWTYPSASLNRRLAQIQLTRANLRGINVAVP